MKHNLQIKLIDSDSNEYLLDYDDSTVIALNFQAYSVESVGDIMLDYTRTFTIPSSPHNNKVLNFVNSTHSTSSKPYNKNRMSIYADGVKIMSGSVNISSIDSGRYSLQLVCGRDFFDTLKAIQFTALGTDTDTNSLSKLLVDYWNNTIRTEMVREHGGNYSSSEEWLEAVVEYTTKYNSSDISTPANDFLIAINNTQVTGNFIHYNSSGEIVASERTDTFIQESSYGYILAQSLFKQDMGETLQDEDYYNGQIQVSPFWVKLERILTILQSVSGYDLSSLTTIIKEIVGKDVFVHIPFVELLIEYDWNSLHTNRFVFFNGELKTLGTKDQLIDGTSLEDLTSSDISSLNMCDFLKMLMQEFCLVVDIDEVNKKVTFHKYNDILTTDTIYQLELATTESKSFALDGIKQKQVVKYDSVADDESDKIGSILFTCDNKNIDEGSEDDELFTIDRYIFKSTIYDLTLSGTYAIRSVDLSSNDCYQKFLIGTPKKTNWSVFSIDYSMYVCGCNANNDDDKTYTTYEASKKATLKQPLWSLEQPVISTNGYISTRSRSGSVSVSGTNVYQMFQDVIRTPIKYEITVKKNYQLLFNFKHFAICKVKGLAGIYYIQSIDDYNPRVDDTITLTLIKLPPQTADFLEWFIEEDGTTDILLEDGGIIYSEISNVQ